MKKWFNKNKIILITFSIISLILIVITYFQVSFITQNFDDLQQYADTGVISDSLNMYGIIAIFNIIFFGIWLILLLLILWKIFFPTHISVKNAFHLNEIKFILKLPSEIKKEIIKK